MGTCSSIRSLTIIFDRENSTYFTDEIICGTICWNTNGEIIRNQQISLEFIGEIGFTKNNSQDSSNQFQYNHEPFYSIEYPILKSTNNSFQGLHTWSFQFPLLNHLPPTLNKPEFYPHVKYYVHASVQKSNENQSKYVIVYPRIDLRDNSRYLSSKMFMNCDQNEMIILKCTMNRLGFVPGDSIDFMLDIDNPNEILIEFIDLFIFQFYEIYLNKSQTMIFHTSLPNTQYLQTNFIRDAFSVPIPSSQLPPSTYFSGGLKTVFTIKQSYRMKLVIKTANVSSDLQLDIPILIATQTKSSIDEQQEQKSNCSIVPSAPTLEQLLLNDDLIR